MGSEIIGFFLIVLGMMLVILSAPALQQAVDTSTGTPLENESTTIKNIYGMYAYIIPLMGFIVLAVGAGMVWKG